MKEFKLKGLLFFFCLLSAQLQAQLQVPQVKSSLDFAGMKLHLTDQARRDIQASVDALYRSEKHFNIMLEKVDLYMPLIEPVFEEYGVPNEFKYLVIQESALVPDAISSSNAVGFWQFKESSATELDMRVNRQVDERMNIISATEGAAKYLLRSNAEFDNWLYSLQSYLMGQGGTSRSVDKRHYGAREMKVDGDTHWYVKKFLSHMVAFENAIGKQRRNIYLYQYTNTGNKSLKHIADEFGTDEEQLIAYNKWLKTSHIPDDKSYAVIVPLNLDESEDLLADLEKENRNRNRENAPNRSRQKSPEQHAYPTDQLGIVEFNGLEGIVAREGDSIDKLAEQGGISERRFRKFNDLDQGDKIVAGQFYYLEKKHRKAKIYEHVLQPDESLWEVSQRYGIRLKKLKQKNRLRKNDQAEAGRVLWLRYIRPASEPVEHREIREPNRKLYASTKTNPATEPLTTPEREPVKDLAEGNLTAAPKNAKQVPAANKKEVADAQPAASSKTEVQGTTAYPGKVLYPADTPAPESDKVQRNLDGEISTVQKDTVISPTTGSKIQKKIEEKESGADETRLSSGGDNNPRNQVKTDQKAIYPGQETSEETDIQEENDFSVDGPVNFIEEDPEKPVAQKDSVHKVEAGETLYSLSRRYGISVPDLIRWNNLPAQPVINVGQQLRVASPDVPESTVAPDTNNNQQQPEDQAPAEEPAYRYHTVSAGESMYRVARMYNVTIKDIMQWNNKENFDIREGEKLVVGKPKE